MIDRIGIHSSKLSSFRAPKLVGFRRLLGLIASLAMWSASPQAYAGCSAGKDLACWWTLSTCSLASLGGAEKYQACVADLSNGYCSSCVDAGAADPNCPVGSHTQGNVCVPYSSLGLQVSGPPGYSSRSVAPNADGHLELVGVSASGSVTHLWENSPSGAFVSSASLFPGNVTAKAFPVLVQRLDGRLETLVTSQAGLVYRAAQLAPNVNWGAWTSISLKAFKPVGLAAGVSPSGNLMVAAVDASGMLWYSQEHLAQWSAWQQAGSIALAAAPTLANNADGRLELFAVASDGRLLHAWQSTQDGDFGGWAVLATGPYQGTPSAIRNLDQRLEVFATLRTGALAHLWQVAANGSWSPEAVEPGVHRFDPATHMNASGTLSVFVVGVNDRAVWTKSQVAPNGSWGNWTSLGGVVSSTPAIGRNASGTLQVFAIGQDGSV